MENKKADIFIELETVLSELIKDCDNLLEVSLDSDATCGMYKDVIGLKLKAELGQKLLSDLRKDVLT